MRHTSQCIKRLTVASSLLVGFLLMGNAYAISNGFYIGGMLGYSNMNYTATNQNFKPGNTEDNSGFAWNGQAGLQVARNFAIQADYYDYGDASFKNLRGIPGAKANYSEHVGDVVGKLIMPLGAFNLNANAGLAYVALDRNANGTAKAYHINPGDKNVGKLTYGLGAGYSLNQNLTAMVNWQQIPSGNGIEQSNFFGAGLDYYFN